MTKPRMQGYLTAVCIAAAITSMFVVMAMLVSTKGNAQIHIEKIPPAPEMFVTTLQDDWNAGYCKNYAKLSGRIYTLFQSKSAAEIEDIHNAELAGLAEHGHHFNATVISIVRGDLFRARQQAFGADSTMIVSTKEIWEQDQEIWCVVNQFYEGKWTNKPE